MSNKIIEESFGTDRETSGEASLKSWCCRALFNEFLPGVRGGVVGEAWEGFS
ncbi:hypothetical protein [Chromobacterium haemolyticum]|uniref:hypothetical protein n=1 Tax=Chromobacterium haemolyticum TaxID=394935 RepID=UPI00174725ED|nr:hypothetical protein [Chromobacterium haemolyticum]QOD84446.1 hypothetical protein IEZ30_08245 [Chromobacterium haemolyticum]